MSTQTKQKDAVYEAITQVVGPTNGKVSLTKEQLTAAATTIATGLTKGTVAHKNSASLDDKTALSYARTLIKNWLTRDARLNGGVKNPSKTRTASLGTAGYPEEVQAIFNKGT